jgi:ABC-type sugar transport system permease subunit
MPFFVILFLAGLKAVDKDQYEAAAVDARAPGVASCMSRCRASGT